MKNSISRRFSPARLPLILILSLSWPAASEAESVTTDSQTQGYDSVIEAVTAASNRYNPASIQEDREFMGIVFLQEGHFHYTVTAGKPGQDRISIILPDIDRDDLRAFWHTHGRRASYHKYFSQIDTKLANQWSKPFYLADYTGRLKVYQPRANTLTRYQAQRLGLPSKSGYALGDRVKDKRGNSIRIRVRPEQ